MPVVRAGPLPLQGRRAVLGPAPGARPAGAATAICGSGET